MKKNQILLLIMLVFIGIVTVRIIAGGNEDTWVCSNGNWVKHGNPTSVKPTSGCGNNNKVNLKQVKVDKIPVSFNIPDEYIFSQEEQMNLTTKKPYAVSFTIQNYENTPNSVKEPYQLYGIYQWDTPKVSQDDFALSSSMWDSTTVKKFMIGKYQAISGINKGERARYNIFILKDGYIVKLSASGSNPDLIKITDEIVQTASF